MNLIYLENYFIITAYWADGLPLNLPLNLFTLPPLSFTTQVLSLGVRVIFSMLPFIEKSSLFPFLLINKALIFQECFSEI